MVDTMTETTLKELRKSQGLTQAELAERLCVDPSAVVKIERRSNQNIATIRKHIEALGGEMVVVARFPKGDFALTDLRAASH